REIGGHQRAEGRERMRKRLRNQRMRCDDQRAAASSGMDGNAILLRIKHLLPFHCLPQFFVSFRERNGTNPGHGFDLPPRGDGCDPSVFTPYMLAPAIANNWKMLSPTQSRPGAGSIILGRWGMVR